jgi:TolB-like protein
MKTLSKLFLATFLTLSLTNLSAQNRIAVLAVDSKGIVLDPEQLSNLLRIELEKTNSFNVLDKYDVQSILKQKNIDFNGCLSKTCIMEAGKALDVDKVLSGSIERYDEKILINIRMISIKNPKEDKNQVNEFLNVQPEIQSMIGITLKNMLGLKNEEQIVRTLTKDANYENAINNPGKGKLHLSGPRMGMTFITGKDGERMSESKEKGGYDIFPVMSQFGYQFETQYLTYGNFQALIEFLPTVTGIDQALFIPSFTLLNGFRNNKNGLEFAFGPSLGFIRKANGYYDNNNIWHKESEWSETYDNPHPIVDRIDKNGVVEINSGFVFAIGKTFKSGALNIPVNIYVVPGKTGTRIGASFGFNLKR